MRQRKKVWSICLVIALVFSSIFTWNEPALTAYASETKTEKIVVYVAAQGKSLDGTKTVAIDKTPVQVDKGTNAAAAVKAVLDASDYKDNYYGIWSLSGIHQWDGNRTSRKKLVLLEFVCQWTVQQCGNEGLHTSGWRPDQLDLHV